MLASVQYLRALAALLVVYFHCRNHVPGVAIPLRHGVGLAGVDLFFVISGFVMTLTTADNRYSARQFLVRRIIRVVPLYWIVTAATTLLIVAFPSAFRSSRFTPEHLLLSLLFVPHENPGEPGSLTPLVKLGWTLNYEMLFYVLFGCCMVLRPAVRSLLVAAALAILAFGVPAAHPSSAVLRVWGSPIILEFALGMLVGHLYASGLLGRVRPSWALAVVAAASAALVTLGTLPPLAHRLYIFGVPSAALVAGLVALEARGRLPRLHLARFLGDASYSVYLSHLFALVAVRAVWLRVGPSPAPASTLGFIGVGMLAGSAVGAACYLAVERPSLQALQRRLARPRPLDGRPAFPRTRSAEGDPTTNTAT